MGHKRLALSVRRLLESRSCGLIVRVHSRYARMADEMDSRTDLKEGQDATRRDEGEDPFGRRGGVTKSNLDAFDDIYGADCVLHSPPLPDVQGVEALKAHLGSIRSAYSDITIAYAEMIGEGGRIA